MKKSKLLFIGLSIFLFSIISVSAVGTVTIVTPSTGSALNGDWISWNVSITDVYNTTNCSLYISSSSTANSTVSNVSVGLNASTNATYIANSTPSNFNTTTGVGLEDSNDYSLYASCVNATGNVANSTAITVTIDNTVPNTPTSLSPASVSTDTDGLINFSASVTDANTTSCYLYFFGTNPGSPGYTGYYTGSTCYYYLTGVPEQTFNYTWGASDGTNFTNASSIVFYVSTHGGGVNPESLEYIQSQGETLSIADQESLGISDKIIYWVLGIIAVGIIFYFIFRKK